jgi:hypothetical protein
MRCECYRELFAFESAIIHAEPARHTCGTASLLRTGQDVDGAATVPPLFKVLVHNEHGGVPKLVRIANVLFRLATSQDTDPAPGGARYCAPGVRICKCPMPSTRHMTLGGRRNLLRASNRRAVPDNVQSQVAVGRQAVDGFCFERRDH